MSKPARMLTVSDNSGDETLFSLVSAYNASRQQPGKKGYVAPVHMLDRPVSGLVMFALSSKAAARLAEMFRERRLAKTYLAVVHGTPKNPEATLTDYLLKDKNTNTTRVVAASAKDGKKCVLSYSLLSSQAGLSLLEVKPVTGRSHQIRVQLANAGLPIYGDHRYGSKAGFENAIALHAWRLAFEHPVSKESLSFRKDPPPTWEPLIVRGALDV